MMKYNIALILLCSFLMSTAFGQDWKRQMEDQERRIEQKMKDQQNRVDLRFANQLKRIWLQKDLEDAEEAPGIVNPEIPKVYNPQTDRQLEDVQLRILPPDETMVSKNAPHLRISPVDEVMDEVVVEESEAASNEVAMLPGEMSASYFGSSIAFRYDPNMRFRLEGRITENKIAQAWERLERTEYDGLMYQITRETRRMRLNDWGYCQLINAAAKQIYPGDKNSQTIFNWFMLSKSGFISTVSYERDRVFLLVPTKQKMYGKTFLRGKSYKLYAVDFDGNDPHVKSAKVFSHKYPATKKVLDLSIKEIPRLGTASKKKYVSFDYEGKTYKIPVEVNRNVIEFYEKYPFVDLDIYLQTPLSPEARRSMVASLRRIVTNLEPQRNRRTKEEEQVHFLLRFVQNAFAYKSDAQQFGGEKYLFADETLYYPYSDCEDRSVLFAWLVRELVGLDVVGVMYPGHAATAVKFSRNVPGDYIQYRGQKYTLCDPTYINATYGMILPEVRHSRARVVDFTK
ncbi:MAG: hypothetical protein AAFY71_01005 [Bacteroidota bacterium]